MKIPPDRLEISQHINEAIHGYADKDWNYSRIRLISSRLEILNSPYALWIDCIDTREMAGQAELKRLREEIAWGRRHGDELGLLEIISLRLNRAIDESTSDQFWDYRRPIIRLIQKQELEAQDIVEAFWYEVQEVGGEEFDSR